MDFFQSVENLVGASPDKPFFNLTDCLAIAGIGPDKNATCIVDSDGSLIVEANNENLFWLDGCIYRFRYPQSFSGIAIERALRLQKESEERMRCSTERIKIYDKCLFMGHAFGWYAYGHLHDSLQRIYFCREDIKKEKWKIVVNRYDRVVEFLEHLRALVGSWITEEDLILIDNACIYEFDNLVYSHSPAVATSYTKESIEWIHSEYIKYFSRDSSWPRRIYLSRNHVRPGFRGVLNEEELAGFLKTQEFTVISGSEPLADIVNYFANAEIIVGAHGSLFANTFLSKPDCRILELCPHNRVDMTFKNKLKLADYYTHRIVQADESHNISIDPQDILDII